MKFSAKKTIQWTANRLGYRVGRLLEPTPCENAFQAMQRLLYGIKEPIIFDVGSHSGHVCRIFREVFPKSVIYAFEPFKNSYDTLHKNTSGDSRIHTFPFGLSDREGVLSFHSNPSSENNSLLASDDSSARTWGSGLFETQQIVEAEFKTIDSVVQTMGIPRIDLLKIDVQGAQHLVMAGAAETLRRGLVRLIYSEVITQPTYKGQKRFDAALTSFYENGFDLYNIYNPSVTSEGRLRQMDVIFTKEKSAGRDR